MLWPFRSTMVTTMFGAAVLLSAAAPAVATPRPSASSRSASQAAYEQSKRAMLDRSIEHATSMKRTGSAINFVARRSSANADTIADLDNGSIDVPIGDNGDVTAAEGSGSNRYQILYGYPDPGTSFSSVDIDGDEETLPELEDDGDDVGNPAAASADVPSSGPYDQRSWELDGVIVTQTVTLVESGQETVPGSLHLTLRITNDDSTTHVGSLRTEVDTDVNSNDGAIFRVPGGGIPTYETEYDGASVPDRMSIYASLSDTQHVAGASFASDIDTRPDRLVLGYWPNTHESTFDYDPDPDQTLSPDSSYLAYWDDRSVAPGASVAVATTYGSGQVAVDTRPPLTVGLDAPDHLDAGTSAAQPYADNPFTVGVEIDNQSTTATAHGVVVSLAPGGGLSTSSPPVQVGDIPPSGSVYEAFQVTAAPQVRGSTLTYAVNVSDSDGSKSSSGRISVPAAVDAPVRYVAIGDSYSAGEGSQGEDDAALFDANRSGCDRSKKAYSAYATVPGDTRPITSLAAAGDGAFLFGACQSATSSDYSQRAQVTSAPPGGGQVRQNSYVAGGADLVTATFGGNDVGFEPALIACLALGHHKVGGVSEDCASEKISYVFGSKTFESPVKKLIFDAIANENKNLTPVFQDLASKAKTVVVMGYPQIFPEQWPSNCVDAALESPFLDTDDLTMFRQATTAVNEQIALSAARAGVIYADPTPYFANHSLCGSQGSWFNGATPATVYLRQAYHPTVQGYQQGYAPTLNAALALGGVGRGLPSDPAPSPGASLTSTGAIAVSHLSGGSRTAAADPAAQARLEKGPSAGALQVSGSLVAGTAGVVGASGGGCDTAAVAAGNVLTMQASGFAPHQAVRVDYLSSKLTVTNVVSGVTADGSGGVAFTVPVPLGATHDAIGSLQVVGLAPGNGALVVADAPFAVQQHASCAAAPSPGTLVLANQGTRAFEVSLNGHDHGVLKPHTVRYLQTVGDKRTLVILKSRTGSREMITTTIKQAPTSLSVFLVSGSHLRHISVSAALRRSGTSRLLALGAPTGLIAVADGHTAHPGAGVTLAGQLAHLKLGGKQVASVSVPPGALVVLLVTSTSPTRLHYAKVSLSGAYA